MHLMQQVVDLTISKFETDSTGDYYVKSTIPVIFPADIPDA